MISGFDENGQVNEKALNDAIDLVCEVMKEHEISPHLALVVFKSLVTGLEEQGVQVVVGNEKMI